MTEELKPCPFCGGKPVITAKVYEDGTGYGMGCGYCACSLDCAADTKLDALRAWNRRVSPRMGGAQ